MCILSTRLVRMDSKEIGEWEEMKYDIEKKELESEP